MRKIILLLTTLIVLLTPAIGQAQDTPTPMPETLASAANLPAGITALGHQLASYLGVRPDEITINQLQEMSYRDSCMGAALPDEQCQPNVVSPAYSVIFGTPLGDFEFHLDGSTGIFRLARPIPMEENKLPSILWQRTGGFAGICHRLFIAASGQYRLIDCYAAHQTGNQGILAEGVLSESDQAELGNFLFEYRPFRWPQVRPPIYPDQFVDTYVANGTTGGDLPSDQEQANFNDYLAELADELVHSNAPAATERPVIGDSGIEGQALIGPTCPVERQNDPCPDRPYQATITILDATGQPIEAFETGADGRFRIPLPPGIYILHPESPNVMPRGIDQTVTVNPGEYTQVTISYDSGIR